MGNFSLLAVKYMEIEYNYINFGFRNKYHYYSGGLCRPWKG